MTMTTDVFKWAVESGRSVEWHGVHGYPGFFALFEEAEILYFETADELKAFLAEVEQTQEGGIYVKKDYGRRPIKGWWQRLLLGAEVWDILPCFQLHWYLDYAALSFEDRIYCYNAIDHRMYQPGDIPVKIRTRLNVEDANPTPREECMLKYRAFRAVREFIETGNRPDWLSYRRSG